MIRSHLLRLSLFGAGISLALIAGQAPAVAQSGDAASPAFGKLINAAKAELSKGHSAAASRDVNAAAAIGNNSYEQFVVQQMRGAIAAQSGDYNAAIASYIAQINSGRLPASTVSQMVEAVAGMEMQAKNYPQAAAWADRYFKQGGTDSRLRATQLGAHYAAGDYAVAYKLQLQLVKATVKAGQVPAENDFDMLYACALKLKDNASVIDSLKHMVIYYPKPQYWTALINNVINGEGFNVDMLEYDTGLLQVSTGTLTSGDDYMTLVQTAIQGGHNGMALKLFNQATASNVFGTGTPAVVSRQQRLLKLINTNIATDKAQEPANLAAAAKNGSTAASVGYNLIDADQADQGFALMTKGIEMGVKNPDLSNLRLGEAYAEAGRKADALKAFAAVGGTDGTQGLAQLWILHLNQKS